MLPLVYHTDYVVPLPAGHRFPMQKFGLIYELLLREGVATPAQFHTPEIVSLDLIEKVHSPDYVAAYCTGALDTKAMRRIGLPWSAALVKRTLTAVSGTLCTAELALQHGLACSTAGGTHHAFCTYGSGFCIFNDLAITSRVLLDTGKVRSILIVDLDVHQGDGTAAIFQQDPQVFTFSMHGEKNFPFIKQQSDLDVPLPDGMEDEEYLRLLDYYLVDLLTEVQPDLVLYDAGVDIHKDDPLGRLALTTKGLYKRDLFVLRICLAQGVPVACVVGGGYARDLQALAYRHSLLHRAATVIYHDCHL